MSWLTGCYSSPGFPWTCSTKVVVCSVQNVWNSLNFLWCFWDQPVQLDSPSCFWLSWVTTMRSNKPINAKAEPCSCSAFEAEAAKVLSKLLVMNQPQNRGVKQQTTTAGSCWKFSLSISTHFGQLREWIRFGNQDILMTISVCLTASTAIPSALPIKPLQSLLQRCHAKANGPVHQQHPSSKWLKGTGPAIKTNLDLHSDPFVPCFPHLPPKLDGVALFKH